MPKGEPYIPETITVHLGRPDADAMNVEVPFADYIKKCENRKPQIAAQYNLDLPVIQWQKIYHKTHPTATNNLRKICGGLGIILPVCERIIDLPEGLCCMNHDTNRITIIIIK